MPGAESTLNTLLKQYPNAKEILKSIGYIAPGILDTPEVIFHNAEGNTTAEVIKKLSLAIRPCPLKENIYPTLSKSLYLYLQDRIKDVASNYQHIIFDCNALAESLAQQSVDNLSDAVRQLCLFCTRLNQSDQYRIPDWGSLFKLHPLLTQNIESHVSHTICTITDILYKIEIDQQHLITHFNIKDYTLLAMEIFLGDLHQHGKSIAKVSFTDLTLVYKPRNAVNEMLVNDILSDLYDDHDEQKPGIPECLSFDDHSWHRYVEFTRAESENEVFEYYRKIGKSLALFYCLNGTDFHYENIIYSKGKPWFIDLECIFTISIRPDFITDSVLNSLIIPTLQGAAFDTQICGIGAKGKTINKTSPEIDAYGKVYLKVYPVQLGGGSNTPDYKKNELNARIIEEVLLGYDEMVLLLKEKQSVQQIIGKAKSLRGRILFRATKLYGDILTIADHPAYSSTPLLRKIYIACALYNENIAIDVIKYEYTCLVEGRIPVFYVDLINEQCYTIDGTQILIDDDLINRHAFLTKAYRVTSAEETVLQKQLITISLKTLFQDKDDSSRSINGLDPLIDFITTKTCHCHKKDIYLNLKREMNESRSISVMRGDLYNGLGGALFLQICNVMCNGGIHDEEKLIKIYKATPDDDSSDYFGCFDSSNGGILYCEYLIVKHVNGLLEKRAFFSRLLRTVRIIINKDDANSDVLAGIAGILIVACRMHTAFPARETEAIINLLTKKLLSQARQFAHDQVTWGRGWTGFSHGNAGIVYALGLANNVLHNAEVNNIIIKALKYENSFRIDSGWNDISTYNTGKDYNSWCHGATGIYMSRVAMLKEVKYENTELMDILQSDISHYQHTQINRPSKNHLSLCHGLFGNAIIDPDRYGTWFDTQHLRSNMLEEKSLMLGEIGAIYTNLYFSHRDKNIPNLLLLE